MNTTNKIDYYPFGMLMPGRSQYTNEYRYGFNGKENIDEMYGSTGTFQDYGFRMYDPRTCRFISVDPITKEYPELTPYQFASLNPILMIDLDGLGGVIPFSQIYTPEQNAKYGPRAGQIGLHIASFTGSVVFTVATGPVGLIYGPSSIALTGAILARDFAPNTEFAKNTEKLPSTFVGVVAGSITAAAGGNFETGAAIGDLWKTVATARVPEKGGDVALLAQAVVDVTTSAKAICTSTGDNGESIKPITTGVLPKVSIKKSTNSTSNSSNSVQKKNSASGVTKTTGVISSPVINLKVK